MPSLARDGERLLCISWHQRINNARRRGASVESITVAARLLNRLDGDLQRFGLVMGAEYYNRLAPLESLARAC